MAKSFCMMKELLPILALGCSALAFGQTEEPIEYFTDSDVSDTRFSFAATYAPAFASRRLALYEPQMDGEEIYALNSEVPRESWDSAMELCLTTSCAASFIWALGS